MLRDERPQPNTARLPLSADVRYSCLIRGTASRCFKMVSRRSIKNFTDEIARRFRPQKIILFGSYAYGKPTEDSDVDLLVVMPNARRKGRMSLNIRLALDYD